MASLFWLSDGHGAQSHLPKNQPGARRVDDRRVISGILHVRRSAAAGAAARLTIGHRPRPTIDLTAGRGGASGSRADHQALGIEVELTVEPGLALAQDVETVLLAGVTQLYLNAITCLKH
jgi:hypothetical protein